MKINIRLGWLFLLSLATGVYTSIKATNNDLSYQEEEKTSAYTRSSYTHGTIPTPDNTTKIERAALKQELLKMHQDAIAAPYENTYVHYTLIVHWLRKSDLILKQSQINIIIDYTAEQRPVYFFLGATGAGKSTAIFALQGNQVTRDQEEESDDDDWDSDGTEANEKKSDLIFEKTVQVKTPIIGHSAESETVGAIVYYPEDRRQNMAFCDTEGFLGERTDVSEAEQYISAFAPFFALKTNTIGGIVVVVSAHGILGGRGDLLKSSTHFFRTYFSAANDTIFKKSMLLMITQYGKNKAKVTRALRNMVQMSYQAYFKALEKEAQNINHNNHAQQTNRDIAALQPFFSMLLENPVRKGAENEIQNFRFDSKRMLFFDPCSTKSIQKTFKKLSTLQTFDHRHLCRFDNPLSQYLRDQILAIGDKIKEAAVPILQLQQKIKIQGLQLKEAKSKEALQGLIDQLQYEISALKQKNEQHQKDDSLTCVFEDQHVEKLHLSRQGFILAGKASMGAVVRSAVANRSVETGAGAVVGGAMGAVLLGGPIGALAGAGMGAVVTVGAVMLEGAKNSGFGYFANTFTYRGVAPIFRIVVTYENAELDHVAPKESVIKEHFAIDKKGDAAIRYTATAKSKSVKRDKWAFSHATHFFKNANCHITMYAKKSELASTRKLIADNVQKIKNKQASIKACSEEQDGNYESNQQKLQKDKNTLIIQQKSTFDMLDTWAKYLFRPDGQDVALLKSYLSDFASGADLSFSIKQQAQTQLPPGQLLIPADGQCLYTAVIMGYLLPVRQVPDKVTTRMNQLFGCEPPYLLNQGLYSILENPTGYLTYLNTDAFGKLVTAFMDRMEIKKGTWGGPQEIQIIATKLKVNIQEYYPDPSNPTNLVQSDLTTPHQENADITLHIVRDKVHPAEVLTQAEKMSAEDISHYQHYRLKYTLALNIN